MPPELIDITGFCGRLFRNSEVWIIFFCAVVDLIFKAPVKIKSVELQFRKLFSEQLHIPRRFIRLVIDDPQGFDLLFGERVRRDAGGGVHPEFLRGEKPAVTDDNAAVFVDDKRLDEAELTYRLGDVGDLGFIMLFGVFGVGDEFRDFPFDDDHKKITAPFL